MVLLVHLVLQAQLLLVDLEIPVFRVTQLHLQVLVILYLLEDRLVLVIQLVLLVQLLLEDHLLLVHLVDLEIPVFRVTQLHLQGLVTLYLPEDRLVLVIL